ncbi:MAG: hypothetical protein RJA70_934 [Pseudomonadota bacterium]|jgi:hypothetical protein
MEFAQAEEALVATSLASLPTFNVTRDLLAIHYDNSPDKDDGHCQPVTKMVIDKLGIQKVSVVNGSYGDQDASSYQTQIAAVTNAAFGVGKCNPNNTTCGLLQNGWIDAHVDWNHNANALIVTQLANLWLSVIENAGDNGHVFVQEAG